jgi:TolB-like protein/DNA-binding winged helix-turn-helix (wHTH) protein/tetratricopeptide (TPR) repeat protein
VSSRKLRFDGWVLDPESGDLERAGTRVRLQEQPVQVLRELITHAGSVVPREQLIALLWPKGVVDFDTGLNTVIHKLRSALGDTSETPRYIETLPRRGYRFIGALDPDGEAPLWASAAVLVSAVPGASQAVMPQSQHEPTVLPDGALTPLSGGRESPAWEVTSATASTTAPVRGPRSPVLALIAALVVVVLLAGAYALWRARSGADVTSVRVQAPSLAEQSATVASAGAVAFAPPLNSIAVLPFVNISGDKEQEYFSDGLSEELLNSLAEINELQVAARTSAFSFKGKDTDIGTIARKLNVGAVLEGSVRRSGNTVRVTAQLINAVTGFRLWSHTYDRDLGDVLKLQTEIANAVASALKVTMLGDEAAKIVLGGTHNPAAFDAYLRGSKAYEPTRGGKDLQTAIAAFTEAIRLDPNYALAFAGRSLAHGNYAGYVARPAIRAEYDHAYTDARQAIKLAPALADGHLALARFFELGSLEFTQASAEYERAIALARSAGALSAYSRFAVFMGRTEAGLAAGRRALVLDPLNPLIHFRLGYALFFAHRYQESVATFNDALALDPESGQIRTFRGLSYYGLGDLQNARASCETNSDYRARPFCLALTYQKLGRHADAQRELATLRNWKSDVPAYKFAVIYAQWGDTLQAVEQLEASLRLRESDLGELKTDPLLDPLRQEPRFQAVMRELKFPE